MRLGKIAAVFGTALLTMSLAACEGTAETAPAKAETEAPKAESTAAAQTEEKKDAEKKEEVKEASADDKVIRVATPGTYKPFTIFDETTGEFSGFEIDLWKAIAEKSGYGLEFVRLDNPATFAELDLNRVDTVAKQISITPARLEKYDFTQPFFFSPYCLTVREDNDEIKTWADMDGKTIALAEGSAMNEFVANLDPDNKITKNVYESSGVILQEVNMKRADACPYAYLVLPYFIEANPELKLKSVDIENPIYTEVNAYPFARTERGNTIRELADKALTEMMEDGSYAELSKKWFNIDVMETKSAKEYFAANPKN